MLNYPPLPPAGWFTSSLPWLNPPRGHRRHVDSASSASLCLHVKLPAKLAGFRPLFLGLKLFSTLITIATPVT